MPRPSPNCVKWGPSSPPQRGTLPNGWMDQDATWQGGRPRPRPHCVRWRPSSPSPKGQSPQFLAMSIVAKWLPISATAECWALVILFCWQYFLYFYTGSNFSFFSIHIIAIFIQLWVFQIIFYYIASGSTRLSISNASQNSSFVQLTVTVESHILYNRPPLLPSILPLCSGSGSPSNTWFLWPTGVHTQMASHSFESFMQGSPSWPTDRQTDQPTGRQTDTLSAA